MTEARKAEPDSRGGMTQLCKRATRGRHPVVRASRYGAAMSDAPASRSGYFARIEPVNSERISYAIEIAIDLVIGGLPDDLPNPRYHVLVGRVGTDQMIGVGEARTRKQARRALAAVQVSLDGCSEEEIRVKFDLPF